MCDLANRTSDESSGRPSDFESRFFKNRELIVFVARRLLDSHDDAETAVKQCFKTASCNPLVFTNDGAFRSWILRIVIDEALLILSEKADLTSAILQPHRTPSAEAPCRVLTE
jgi:DNA-directed RNA polymerase specialized sigma24 family protein